jgi:hypothetical protein
MVLIQYAKIVYLLEMVHAELKYLELLLLTPQSKVTKLRDRTAARDMWRLSFSAPTRLSAQASRNCGLSSPLAPIIA